MDLGEMVKDNERMSTTSKTTPFSCLNQFYNPLFSSNFYFNISLFPSCGPCGVAQIVLALE